MKISTFVAFCAIAHVSFAARQTKREDVFVLAFFHGDDELTQMAFEAGIKRFNMESQIYNVIPKTRFIGRTDSFKAQQIVCEEVKTGIDAIFGPGSVETSGIVASIAQRLDIPHLIYHWKSTPFGKYNHPGYNSTINLYPDSKVLAGAVADVFKDYDWNKVAIVYENVENLFRLKDVLQVYDPTETEKLGLVKLKKLSGGYGELLKSIKDSKITKIILDASIDKVVPFLEHARTQNMTDEYFSYLFTNLDASIVNMSSLLEVNPANNAMPLTSNLTSIRLTSDGEEMENLVNAMNRLRGDEVLTVATVPHEPALVYDAVAHYTNTLKANGPIYDSRNRQLECDGYEKAPNGLQNFNLMRSTDGEGLTGEIAFKKDGYDKGSRIGFRVEVLQMSRGAYRRIGSWDKNVLKHDTELQNPDDQLNEASQTKVFKILTKFGKPFFSLKENLTDPEGNSLHGNERYEGYVVDLCKEIAKISAPFVYSFEVVNNYAAIQENLEENKGDLAISDITITYERKKKFDFTSPFMTLGIGILHYKKEAKAVESWKFFEPFDKWVWLNTVLTYFAISIMVFILSRINKNDWEPSHPCIQEPEEVESIWNFLNTVWLSMGSIMGQGCDILPKGSSTRITLGSWWFFALIMLASYTANLAAFLTNAMGEKSIQNVEDLAKQTKTLYGALNNGSTHKFFQESEVAVYQRMSAFMDGLGSSVHVTNNEAGVSRVNKDRGDYAFLMETVPMDYALAHNCDLRKVGGPLDSKGYGIALPLNSPWRKKFNRALLLLGEKGAMSEMKEKFWKKSEECEDKEKAQEQADKEKDQMKVGNVLGVFYMLGGGCLAALIVACFEFFFGVQNLAVEEKITFLEAFKSELMFTFNFLKNSKPVRARRSEASSKSSRSQSRRVSETKSLKNKSVRSLSCSGVHDSNSRSLLNLS